MLTELIRRHRARDLYWDAGMDANDITEQLYTTSSPADRAYLLDRLADHKQQLADLHPHAFGAHPNVDECGRGHAESHASAATLTRMVADTERQHAETEPHAVDIYLDAVGPSESVLWRKLATVRDQADRVELLDQIWDYAIDRVGGHAAEVLVAIAATERELANARIEGRPPVAPKTSKRSRKVIAAVFIAVAALLVLPMLLGR